jgi:CubicO group peptidase (beta-lactamase class C family)
VKPLLPTLLALALPATATPDLAPLRTFLTESVKNQKVAGGSLLVIHQGEKVFHEGFGYADLKNNTPFPKDAPVVVASISKPLLGTAVFHLSEAGKIDLDSPIIEHLPAFSRLKLESGEAAARPPTIQELFTHTSGLRNDTAERGRPWLASWVRGQSLEAVVERYAAEFPLKAQPGTRYAYSGIGTDAAARIAEVASGKPRDQFLRHHLAVPLGMSSTFYRSDPARPRILPKRYSINDEGELRPSSSRHTPEPGTYTSSGGSVISTAPDLANWLMMIRNKGLHDGKPYLEKETVDRMLTPAKLGKNSLCGLFIRKCRPDGSPAVIGHTGSSGTNCWIDLDRDIIGIMLTQTKGSDIRKFRAELEKKVTTLLAG